MQSRKLDLNWDWHDWVNHWVTEHCPDWPPALWDSTEWEECHTAYVNYLKKIKNKS